VKFNTGEDGPEGIVVDAARELGNERVMDPDRGPTEGFREDDSEGGSVGGRAGGCCRIRLRPEAPRPCSCSAMAGVLRIEFSQPSMTRCRAFVGIRAMPCHAGLEAHGRHECSRKG
jgi:hypothetical protein